MGSRPHLLFCAWKTAWLAPELIVSMGPCPHLWFLHAKQWLLDQINKSLWVPDLTCRFVHANSVINSRITSLYGFQPSSVVFCIQNSDLRTKIARLYGSHTSPVNFFMQNSVPSTRITCLYRSHPLSVVFAGKTATFGPDIQVCIVPRPHLLFWAHITACLAQEWKDYIASSHHL